MLLSKNLIVHQINYRLIKEDNFTTNLDNSDILMYSTRNGGKSAKSIKKTTANESKSYLPHLNKLVDQYNNIYYHSIGKKPINDNYSASTEKTDTNLKAPKFKVNDRARITKYKNIFSKVYTKSCSREIFILDSVMKTNPWTYNIKDLN